MIEAMTAEATMTVNVSYIKTKQTNVIHASVANPDCQASKKSFN